ncbi:MAG: hypothetical protein PHE24_03320 [Patescibacteria group bacterium]|nr:hypothetical protein [Patescibacteria group bacterium]
MDITEDIIFTYMTMVGYRPSNLMIVVTAHFLVEHFINKIIFAKCKNAKKIIDYSFSTKLELVNAINLLSDDLYKNIKNLNQIRNKIVHTLEINIQNKIFFKSSGQKIIVKVAKSKNPERDYSKLLSLGILNSLRNHMLLILKVSPEYKN